MNKILCLSVVLILISLSMFAQTGINTMSPNSNTLLHVSEKQTASSPPANNMLKGIMIPKLSETERDILTYTNPNTLPLTLRLLGADNSLLIYNTTENCYNFWNQTEKVWKSLCGKLGKSEFTIDCSKIKVLGVYTQTQELKSSNMLEIIVNVTKIGEYTISATTSNGYNFYTTGTFLSPGTYTVIIPGQGIPVNVQTDQLHFSSNGLDVTCSPPITINVLSTAGIYTFQCNSTKINGVYKTGTPLNSTNTVTVAVNVTTLGSYSITTNSVDGIFFSTSGIFTTTGYQTLTLQGAGTPLSSSDKNFTMTSDSRGTDNKTCKFILTMTLHAKRIFTIGNSPNGYGYNFSGTAASGTMLTTTLNFGTNINSVVKVDGITIIDGGSNPSSAVLTSNLLTNPVDIVILGYNWNPNAAEADILVQYLQRKGVFLMYCEENSGVQRILRSLFNNNTISTSSTHAAGALYKLPVINDPVLNGPFGDIRGKYWGEDASSTTRAINIPLNEIIVYSTDADESQSNPVATGAITAFRHKLFNFIWVGDGGFNSNHTGTSNTICPFKLTSTNYPTFKPNYGRGSGNEDVYNAVFTANAIAWALRQAEFNGINTP